MPAILAVSALLLWVIGAAIAMEVPAALVTWYRKPGNSIRALTWTGSIFAVIVTFASPGDSLLGNLRNDAITVAITVIVIEELGRYRAALEEKDRLIRQMGSHGNDFALDAVKQIKANGWDKDGSLCGKVFEGANLRAAKLQEANLQEAYLYWADLQAAKLRGANLQRAILFWADLRKADLRGANLEAADLRGAFLEGANLEGANLEAADLLGAIYRSDTVWPYGFNPGATGALMISEQPPAPSNAH